MSTNNSEIPCQTCHRWNAKVKSFSCSPYKCKKLSEWLADNANLGNGNFESVETQIIVPEAQFQYVR